MLEQEYEIDVEFSEEHKCLVVHKKHPCFGREVEVTLQLMLNELLIISIKSKEIRQFNSLIRKEFRHMSFVRERMKNSRNETFLVINKSEMMDKGRVSLKYLEGFLKHFKMVVDSQLHLKVFFNHIDQVSRKYLVERVLRLAEDHNFILQNQELAERFTTKGVWKIRDLSEVILPKRQRELISFIKGLITRDEQEENPKEIESMYDSFFEEDSSASIATIKGVISAEQRSKIEVKGRLEWFREEFSRPKMRDIEEEDKPFILGRRRRDLEKVFEENSRAKFKIWGL